MADQSKKKKNKAGLPSNLIEGEEELSGHSMDDVRVHYDSSKPDQLDTGSFNQDPEVHIEPPNKRKLPHEAWHVVQQKRIKQKPENSSDDVTKK